MRGPLSKTVHFDVTAVKPCAVGIDNQQVPADTPRLTGVIGIFSGVPPSFIDPKKEEQQLCVLTSRIAQIRELDIDRGITWHFGTSSHVGMLFPWGPESLLKIKKSLLAWAAVKLAVTIH
jgi:hypothetical protein